MPDVPDPALDFFERRFGAPPESVEDVAAHGSRRRYWRLIGPGGETAVAALGPDREENRAFLSFSRAFRSIGLPVPEIHAADEEAGVWIMEDLGDTTLFDLLEEARREGERAPEEILAVYRAALEELIRFQIEGDRVVDYDLAYPRAAFDRQSILWDLAYFKYHFLKLARIPFHEQRLETDFHALADFLLEADTSFFLYRDFQSRNVMVREGSPWFLDYQGGRRGALHYDVASILYDAKADLPEETRASLLEHYLDRLEERREVDREAFRAHYRGYVVVRIAQALGAYGYRGFYERKARFLHSVPYAAANLRRILERGLPVELPEMQAAFERIVEEWEGSGEPDVEEAGLTVYLTSFSYEGGYPEDAAGHGGGFVFDCRGLPNPGREEEHADRTGLDEAVAGWLEERPSVAAFLERTAELVEAQVEEYRRRGFTSLSVAYGCTGGRHRSVYLVERIAGRIEQRFPDVRVRIVHREEPRWPRIAEEDAWTR
ncbi:MAG: RNase adapter RapZ [Gemmatimonadota bacterium]|nr:RNase adapter RapZ [Gemmatimonadota bacterium]